MALRTQFDTPYFRPRVEWLEDRTSPTVRFRFDYSLDNSGFFADPTARAAMERAGDLVGSILWDSLAPIVPFGANTWQAVFLNPTTGRTVRLNNLAIGANELLVFVGADNLGGSTLGSTGTGSASARGSAAWATTVRTRGQPVGSDYGPWGGMIAFDTSEEWDFGVGDPPRRRFSFQSVAEHELLHVLGFGSGTESFERYVTANGFVGPHSVAVYGGAVPLEPGLSADHWASGVISDGREASMTPAVAAGIAQPLTMLDLAALVDIGWTLAAVPPPPPPPPAPPVPPPSPAAPGATARFAVGADEGGSPVVAWLDGGGQTVAITSAFPDDFAGGVRVASADFDGDGVLDVAAGTGPGVATRVRILSGADRHELFAVDPFEESFTGGTYVAAGDVSGDGKADLIITPDEGGGPRVRVFDGNGFTALADFFGIDDLNFRGGARVAVGDVDGDGTGDLIVAAGFQGGPRVAGYSGRSLRDAAPTRVFADFFAFETTLRNGVYIAAGDLNGDGFAEVIAGGGPGGGPRVTAFNGRDLTRTGLSSRQADFFATDPSGRSGVRIAVANLDGDERADLVAGAGVGAGSWVAGYRGANLSAVDTPTAAFEYTIYPGFSGGVFVG